jgi:hypothetical protein
VTRLRYAVSLPERAVRAVAAALGGAVQETAELLLPRLVRRSRLYEASAKNLLRIAVELVGGVEGAARDDHSQPVGQMAKSKTAGNVVEIGSIAAFGFSPLWLLAAASDVLRGSRVYLDELVTELRRAGVLADDVDFASVDELLSALEGGSGRAARLIDVPPLELAELRASLIELRQHAESLPAPDELAAVFQGLRRAAAAERRPLLEVSTGMGLAFLLSARTIGRRHLAVPYEEDWRPVRDEGFAAYARRVAAPYGRAVGGHFHPGSTTFTDRFLDRVRP